MLHTHDNAAAGSPRGTRKAQQLLQLVLDTLLELGCTIIEQVVCGQGACFYLIIRLTP